MRGRVNHLSWGLWMILGLGLAAPIGAVDMEALQREAFEQWTRWIVSRDEEKRSQAARMLAGHGDQPQTVGLLVTALDDREAGVRRRAAGSLWTLAGDDIDIAAAQPALRARLQDPDLAVRVQAAGALEASGVAPAELVEARLGVLDGGDAFDVALAVRDLIGSVDSARLVDPLLWSLQQSPPDSGDDFGADDVLAPLAAAADRTALPGLVRALADPRLPHAPLLAALGRVDPPPPGWNDALLGAARDPDPVARERVAQSMQRQVDRGVAPAAWMAALAPLLDDAEADVRAAAADLFGAAGGSAHAHAGTLAERLASDPDPAVRRAAARALGSIGDQAEAYDRATKQAVAQRATPALEAAAASDDRDLREAAQQALTALRAGSATHTRVLTATAPEDAGAQQRLRERGIEFTEDAFWRAIGERDAQTVEDLLDAGLSPTTIDAQGMPALHFAVMSGCDYAQPTAEATRRIVALLLQRGADPNQVEAGGDNAALHRASSCDAALVKQLLDAKADLRAKNASGLSAFTMFVITSPEAAGTLLDAGFRPDAKERVVVQAMHDAERDPTKRRLLARALGR